MDAGNNVESIEFGEREIFQVQETTDPQENQVDKAPVPNQSVDYAVSDKNEGDLAITLARPSLKTTSD